MVNNKDIDFLISIIKDCQKNNMDWEDAYNFYKELIPESISKSNFKDIFVSYYKKINKIPKKST